MSKEIKYMDDMKFSRVDKKMRLVCQALGRWKPNGAYQDDFHSINGLMGITGDGCFYYQDHYC